MLCVGQWFFTLLRKRVDAVGQVALRGQRSVFLWGFQVASGISLPSFLSTVAWFRKYYWFSSDSQLAGTLPAGPGTG
jgi:hypothetical protein